MIITFFATVMMLLLIPAAAMAADYNCSSIVQDQVLTSSDSLIADDGNIHAIRIFKTKAGAESGNWADEITSASSSISQGNPFRPEERYSVNDKQYGSITYVGTGQNGTLFFYVSDQLKSPLIAEPTLANGLVYDGTAKTLVVKDADVVSGATVQYSLTGRDEDWLQAGVFPTQTNAGLRNVFIKVNGPDGYGDVPVKYVGDVTIGVADITVTPNDASKHIGTAEPELTYSVPDKPASGVDPEISVTRDPGEEAGTYDITAAEVVPEIGASSPNDNYNITFNNPGTFTIEDHTSWIFSASGNIITATCANPDCSYHTELTLTAPEDAVYNGDLWVATYGPNSFIEKTGGDPGSVVYKKDGSQVENATDPGKYTAEITIDNATAKVEFTIAKTDQKITSDDVTMTVGDKDKKIEYTVEGLKDGPECGDVTFEIKSGSDIISVDKNGKIKAKKAGTAIVTITAAENDYYNAASKDVKVTVKEKSSKDKKDADSKSAKTGDNNHTGLWIGIVVVALAAVAAVLFARRRRTN